MLTDSIFLALFLGTFVGLVLSFHVSPFETYRHVKTKHEGEMFTTEYRRDDHSVNTRTTRTALFSLPSDEDLFVGLFLDKKKQGTENPDPNEAKPIRTKIAPPSFDIDTGAGVPRPSLEPDEIVSLLMTAVENVDVPVADAGLVAMWDFASDTTKFVFKNNRTEFIESCHETANEFPTSFYGAAMKGTSWKIETELNRVGGEDGWIATQVTSTISSDGRLRRWQWELRKNRRPPCLGCWKVENIASSDRKGNFEPD